MRKFRTTFNIFAVVISSLAFAIAAQAQAQRTFVSAEPGVADNPSCSRTNPCRSFAAAVAAVAAGGEVVALSSGGYGPFTANKSVTVIAPRGIYAGISAFAGQHGVTVAAGSADVIALENLVLNGLGGTNGVHFTSGGQLHLTSMRIRGFTQHGINFEGAGRLFLRQSEIRNNLQAGLRVAGPSANSTRVSVDRSLFDANATGVQFNAGATGTISESQATGNTGSGFLVEVSERSGATMNLEACRALNNGGAGVRANATTGTATLRYSNCAINGNAIGEEQAGSASLQSANNNSVEDNAVANDGGKSNYIRQ